MKKTVWLVTSGEYSDYSIDGIFSTKEKAKIWCGDKDYFDIVESDLDNDTPEKNKKIGTQVRYQGNSVVMWASPIYNEVHRNKKEIWAFLSYGGFKTLEMSFIGIFDEEIALKKAKEIVDVFLIENKFPKSEGEHYYYDIDTLEIIKKESLKSYSVRVK